MKTKITLAAVLLGTLMSSSAFANTGTVNFIGSITNATCDFVGEQDGALGNTINLGRYSVDNVNKGATDLVSFNLVGKGADGAPCNVIAPSTGVNISWVPALGWGAVGMLNAGTAKHAEVKLMDKDAAPFTATKFSVNYAAADVVEGKLPFKAQLMASGVATAGTVVSAVKFTAAYI